MSTLHKSLRMAPLALSLLLLPACSLLGLADFESPRCENDAECDPLNALEGIDPATACELYQCTQGGACVLRTRDGDDDGATSVACGGTDCDDNDRDAFFGAPVVTTELVSPVTQPSWLHFGGSAAGTATLTYAAGSGMVGVDVLSPDREAGAPRVAGFAMDANINQAANAPAIQLMCPGAAPQPVNPPDEPINPTGGCTTNAECDDGVFCNGFERCDAATGCRDAQNSPCGTALCDESADQCVVVMPASCNLLELAVAHARNDEMIGAAINQSGCANGQLLVGWLTTEDADVGTGIPGANVLVRGNQGRAPSFFGIDLAADTATPRCSGGARADGILGVSSVAVGALPAAGARRRPQGLIAFLGAPACRLRGSCSGQPGASGPVGVEVLGAWLEQAPASNARAVTWVSTTSSGAPQPLDATTDGIASPAVISVDGAEGGYVVAYGASGGGVSARFIGAFADPTEVLATAPFPTQLTGAANETRVTPPIADLGTSVLVGSGAADFVSGAASADGATVLLAWLEGDAVFVAQLDRSGGTLTAGAPMQVSGAAAGAPEVAWIPSVCGPDCGGWAVTWSEGGNGRLMRINAAGTAIDAAPVDLGAAPTRVRAFETDGTLRLAWHDGASNALVVSNGQCPPPPGG